MFGYVKMWKPELKMAEYEQYQGVYCSLCKQLGRRYGLPARMTLSYDFTLLALLGMALTPDCPGFEKSRCSFHPGKKCLRCRESAPLLLAADAAVLMTYHKLHDTIADSGFWKGLSARLLLPFASHYARKAARLRPDLAAEMAGFMERQQALEKAGTASIDAAAAPTADMLATLAELCAVSEEQKELLRRFGYCLGRWIYLMDAVDDLEQDAAGGGYNPYLLSLHIKAGDVAAMAEARDYALLTLNACLAECETAYHLLDRYHFDGILQNILQLGMPAEQRRVTAAGRMDDSRGKVWTDT